jgi:hypothetical protein
MKPFKYSFWAFLLVVSCSEPGEIHKETLHQKPLPTEILARYERKLGLQSLDSGSNSLEIRIWNSFVNDSFPAFMQRNYIENERLRVDYFFFHSKNNLVIRNEKQIDSLVIEKISIAQLPNRFRQILEKQYSLFKIKNFDTNIFDSLNKRMMMIGRIGLILIEQAEIARYKSVFTTNPLPYKGANEVLDQYAAFCNFVTDSLLFQNKNVLDWRGVQLAKIVDSGFYQGEE